MTVLVTDDGFAPDDWGGEVTSLDRLAPEWPGPATALDLPVDTNPQEMAVLAPHLDRIQFIRISFARFSDGRGFTLARLLRRLGYRGRLRASGHLIADQYAMARRSGFDEVEIDRTLAARQTEAQWLSRADWRSGSYQARLGMKPA